MPKTIIDLLFEDNQTLATYLGAAGEASLKNNVEGGFRKILLLSAASYFEHLLTDNLVRIFSDKTNSAEPIVEFIKNKAISRQYHTYFQWDRRNANSFFGLFGTKFLNFVEDQIVSDSELESSIGAFLELGELRNKLVHLNFANYPLDKTVDEIYELYGSALKFVERFLQMLKDFLDTNNVDDSKSADY